MANILVSKKILQSYIKDALPEDKILEDKLTMHIFEVEGVEKVELSDGTTDTVFDIKVLPDRSGYCFSHRYVAQEIAAILKSDFIAPDFLKNGQANILSGDLESGSPLTLNIEVETPEINPLHLGRKISNIDNSESPTWLKDQLKALGQRSINYIVDLTNFVMLDTGQPIHAFDADKVQGKLVVRYAKPGEQIELLDGKKVELDPSIMVIADHKHLLDITGIKGGKIAEVDKDTKNIILIAGSFNSTYIRKISQKINIKNDSSKRFENGVTMDRPRLAIEEFSYLLSESAMGGVKSEGIVFGPITEVGNSDYIATEININPEYINQRIGINIKLEEMLDILQRLDFNPVHKSDENLIKISVPQYRADILIEEDIADEIGRLYGYEGLEGSTLPAVEDSLALAQFEYVQAIRSVLAAELGFSEVYTYTLKDAGDYELANPLNKDRSYLRNTIGESFPKILDSNSRNIELLELDSIKIFEIGKVYKDKNESLSLAIGILPSKSHVKKPDEIVKSNINSALEQVAKIFDIDSSKIPYQKNADNIIEINLAKLINDKTGGELYLPVSELPNYSEQLNNFLKRNTGGVKGNGDSVRFNKISPYPYIVRDIAVFIPGAKGKADELLEEIEALKSDLIVKIYQFDEFEKKNKETGEIEKTSYAFRIVFQSQTRTLTDAEVDTIMQQLYANIGLKEGWEIR